MDLIIKGNSFDINKVSIKNGRNTKKIIYDLGTLFMIGLSFEVKEYIIVNQSNKYLFIDVEKSPIKDIFFEINNYFKNKYKLYKNFIEDNILKIKKHNNNSIKPLDPLFISINNIKIRDSFTKIHLFTI